MKVFLITICCTLMSSMTGQDTTYDSLFFVGKSGLRLPYRALQPAEQTAGKKYPLVLFLHGAGERGNDNQLQLVHGATLLANPVNRFRFPAFVLIPQCRKESYWASVEINRESDPNEYNFDFNNDITMDLQTAIELVDHYIEAYPVDKKRVYIVGLSMGGMGTYEAVYRNPKKFAAAIPICGGADANAYSKKTRKTPFWIFHGDSDRVVPVEFSRQMHARLKELKHSVKYTEYQDVYHNSWDRAFGESEFLSWLFAQKR